MQSLRNRQAPTYKIPYSEENREAVLATVLDRKTTTTGTIIAAAKAGVITLIVNKADTPPLKIVLLLKK